MSTPSTSTALATYTRRADTYITAVKLDLDLVDGLTYRKWGGTQHAERGDWLVRNGDDTYTVDGAVFASTYREVTRGRFVKCSTVWAERASVAGTITTKEGETSYAAGDWLVYNDADRRDGYAMADDRFRTLYEIRS